MNENSCQKIIEVVGNNETHNGWCGLSQREIAEKVGISKQAVSKHISNMKADGSLEELLADDGRVLGLRYAGYRQSPRREGEIHPEADAKHPNVRRFFHGLDNWNSADKGAPRYDDGRCKACEKMECERDEKGTCKARDAKIRRLIRAGQETFVPSERTKKTVYTGQRGKPVGGFRI